MVPKTGDVETAYHTVGAEVVGKGTNQNEIVITIDGLLLASVFIADIDEAMSHFEIRAPYSHKMAQKLSNVMDRNVIKETVLGARAAATITGGFGGTTIANDKFKLAAGGAATIEEKASALAAGIFAAAQALDEKDVPEDSERFCVLRPAEYYTLVQNTTAINRDWGGAGIYSDGKVWRIAGVNILKSNQVPKLDSTLPFYDPAGGVAWVANPEYNAFHIADCAKTIGVVWTPEAVGTVKLMDLSLQSEWDIRRQGTLMVARYSVGHDFVRPECCVELKLSALDNTISSYDADGV